MLVYSLEQEMGMGGVACLDLQHQPAHRQHFRTTLITS